ncbi:FAD-dependent oxidoreductase [Streptomyces noursei]|uniref:FAD-dependent oxidoreductase n=1 Tax=Streptomyces noursei TaxID=1971 RepID=UPI0015E0BE0F|nr:NAD(P)/FAD-dependent oxidoreductase [Streptomyces noursei]
MTLRVLIAGAGVGGLALAQALRQAGLAVTVFERTPTVRADRRGYRININRVGGDALAACLPKELFRLYLATSNDEARARVAVFDHRMHPLYATDVGIDGTATPRDHTGVNRLTLRQIMLAGLEREVRFGQEVVGFEQTPDRVRVLLADGSTAEGDLLVGADGVGSAVRAGLLPDVRTRDTGVRCLWGRTTLSPALRDRLPAPLFDRVAVTVAPQGHIGIWGAYRARRPHAEAAAAVTPAVSLDPEPDYLMWVLSGEPGGPFADEEQWRTASPAELHRHAADATAGWHPALHQAVREAVPEDCFVQNVRVADQPPAWPAGRVTLLGDAIHPMSPAGGTGANTALRDAAALADKLTAVRHPAGLASAVDAYETEMRRYGFAAVAESLHYGERFAQAIRHAGKETQR